MPKIWERNRLYRLWRPGQDFLLRCFYAPLRQEGTYPEDGPAVILAPNHTNTLLDPLVLLPGHPRIVFGARQDVFKPGFITWFLRSAGVLPITRARDGLKNVANNLGTLSEMEQCLDHGVPVCLFSEGTHRMMHSLQPVKKGIVRVALESASRRPTVIVPVGIEYGDWLHPRCWCTVRYGTPIDVNAYVAQYAGEPEAHLFQALEKAIFDGIAAQILYIPDDALYQIHWAPHAAGWSRRKPRPWLHLLTAPLFALAALLALPVWGPGELLCRKVKDKAFHNSVRFLTLLFLLPLWLLVLGLLVAFTLPWFVALPLWLYTAASWFIFYEWLAK